MIFPYPKAIAMATALAKTWVELSTPKLVLAVDALCKSDRLLAIANLLVASVFKFMKLLSTSVLDKGLPLAVAPVTRVIITAIDSPYLSVIEQL